MSSKKYFQLTTRPAGEPEQTLLLISTALDGPARVPFRLTETSFPSDLLGDSPLFHAYDMASQSGATDIILYRLNGQYASKDINGMVYDAVTMEEVEKPVMQIRSVTANEKHNKFRFVFEETGMTAYDDLGEKQRTYLYAEYPTAKELVDGINLDSEHGMVSFEAFVKEPFFATRRLQEVNFIVELSGGSNESEFITDREANKSELNSRLLTALFSSSAYDQEEHMVNSDLGMMDFGIISVDCLYHDDDLKLEETMGKFCLQKSNDIGKGCIAVIGVKPLEEPTVESVTDKTRELVLLSRGRGVSAPGAGSSEAFVLEETVASTWESHIQVVIGDGIRYSVDGLSELRVSLSSAYAGLQSSLAINASTTNKQLSGFDHLSYELDKENIDNLLGNGYISIIRSIRKGFVPYSETTYVRNTSSILRNPSAIRVSHYVSRRLAEMLDDAVGTRVTQMTRREMMAATTELVQSLLTTDIVKDFNLGFVNSHESQGNLSIKLDIIPYLEVSSISSLVKLPFIQGGV